MKHMEPANEPLWKGDLKLENQHVQLQWSMLHRLWGRNPLTIFYHLKQCLQFAVTTAHSGSYQGPTGVATGCHFTRKINMELENAPKKEKNTSTKRHFLGSMITFQGWKPVFFMFFLLNVFVWQLGFGSMIDNGWALFCSISPRHLKRSNSMVHLSTRGP